VDERVSEHAQGLIKAYTEGRLPVELAFSEHYERFDEAVAAERRIKGWLREEGSDDAKRFRGFIRAS
jgi:putative endonuclease